MDPAGTRARCTNRIRAWRSTASTPTASDPVNSFSSITANQQGFNLSPGQQVEVGVKQSHCNGRAEWTFAAYRPDEEGPADAQRGQPVVDRAGRAAVVARNRGVADVDAGPLPRRSSTAPCSRRKFDDFKATVGGERRLAGRERAAQRARRERERDGLLGCDAAPGTRGACRATSAAALPTTPTSPALVIPSYTVLDLGTRWRARRSWPGPAARQLTDEVYADSGSATAWLLGSAALGGGVGEYHVLSTPMSFMTAPRTLNLQPMALPDSSLARPHPRPGRRHRRADRRHRRVPLRAQPGDDARHRVRGAGRKRALTIDELTAASSRRGPGDRSAGWLGRSRSGQRLELPVDVAGRTPHSHLTSTSTPATLPGRDDYHDKWMQWFFDLHALSARRRYGRVPERLHRSDRRDPERQRTGHLVAGHRPLAVRVPVSVGRGLEAAELRPAQGRRVLFEPRARRRRVHRRVLRFPSLYQRATER